MHTDTHTHTKRDAAYRTLSQMVIDFCMRVYSQKLIVDEEIASNVVLRGWYDNNNNVHTKRRMTDGN